MQDDAEILQWISEQMDFIGLLVSRFQHEDGLAEGDEFIVAVE